VLDGGRHAVDAEACEPLLQKIDEIPPLATARVQHAAAPVETPAQELIEEIDVDLAKLSLDL
jgi:hypothetical protein